MSEVIYGKDWLVYSAGVLQLQVRGDADRTCMFL